MFRYLITAIVFFLFHSSPLLAADINTKISRTVDLILQNPELGPSGVAEKLKDLNVTNTQARNLLLFTDVAFGRVFMGKITASDSFVLPDYYILQKWDGTEIRMPFLDNDIYQAALTLAKQFLDENKLQELELLGTRSSEYTLFIKSLNLMTEVEDIHIFPLRVSFEADQ